MKVNTNVNHHGPKITYRKSLAYVHILFLFSPLLDPEIEKPARVNIFWVERVIVWVVNLIVPHNRL